jgi:hypothetical protein
MRLCPHKPGFMPPLQRRHIIVTNPVVAPKQQQLRRRALHQRAAMHCHFSRPHTENADAPHSDGVSPATHQRGTQRRTRMRLDPLRASLAPQLQRLPPLSSWPLIRIERHQLLRRRHSSTADDDGWPSGSLTSQLSNLHVRHTALPTPLRSRTSVPLPRTQPRLLICIRQSQRIDQPTQQQTVILNDLQQRIRRGCPLYPATTNDDARNSASSNTISSAVAAA